MKGNPSFDTSKFGNSFLNLATNYKLIHNEKYIFIYIRISIFNIN